MADYNPLTAAGQIDLAIHYAKAADAVVDDAVQRGSGIAEAAEDTSGITALATAHALLAQAMVARERWDYDYYRDGYRR